MAYEKPPLSPDEKQVHAELLELAGGMGCMTDRATIKPHQMEVLEKLKRKGYVMVTSNVLSWGHIFDSDN